MSSINWDTYIAGSGPTLDQLYVAFKSRLLSEMAEEANRLAEAEQAIHEAAYNDAMDAGRSHG